VIKITRRERTNQWRCFKALKAGNYDLKIFAADRPAKSKKLHLAENPPLIRDLTVYSNFINQFSLS